MSAELKSPSRDSFFNRLDGFMLCVVAPHGPILASVRAVSNSLNKIYGLRKIVVTAGLPPGPPLISGATEALQAHADADGLKLNPIRRLVAIIKTVDPDVIENHNLRGFDLPFLSTRARANTGSMPCV